MDITSLLCSNVVIKRNLMPKFKDDEIRDFKHVIYNLLADTFNEPDNALVVPITIADRGEMKHGFRIAPTDRASKKLAELYSQYVRKARLDIEDQNSILTQDLYKFYFRACLELLSKYFQKKDKYTYLYDGNVPLFIPGCGDLSEAEKRIKCMVSRARKRKAESPEVEIVTAEVIS